MQINDENEIDEMDKALRKRMERERELASRVCNDCEISKACNELGVYCNAFMKILKEQRDK